jgi:23S rRNA (adenine2503-C2)-methyltransferase
LLHTGEFFRKFPQTDTLRDVFTMKTEAKGVNILGMSRSQLAEFVVASGEPRYRGNQLFTWMYTKRAESFDAMSDLGKVFRRRLESSARMTGVRPLEQQFSRRDGTTKFLFELADGLKIESVLIPPASGFRGDGETPDDEQRRLTQCVSTQVGCPLDCAFCATGTMGFTRNLTAGEILDQVLQVRRATGRKVTNIVFMGMGEPLLNYEAVMTAAEVMSTGMNIAARRTTVSTAGRADRIRNMGEEKRNVKLAVSLHSAVDETRSLLMPINRKYPLSVLSEALTFYYAQTRQRLTFEVILFDGVNDTDREVDRLIAFARRIPSKVNMIPFHPITFTRPTGFAASLRPSPKLDEIVERMRSAHLTVMVRSSAGEDIDAACGQLALARIPGAGAQQLTTQE